MSDQEFTEKVIANLATIKANMKWIMAIGTMVCVLSATAFGTLWLRTEVNSIGVAEVHASVAQHVNEVEH